VCSNLFDKKNQDHMPTKQTLASRQASEESACLVLLSYFCDNFLTKVPGCCFVMSGYIGHMIIKDWEICGDVWKLKVVLSVLQSVVAVLVNAC